MKKQLLIVLLLCLLLTTLYADDNNNALGFSAMKTKYISTDVNIELPIYFSGYTANDEFTYRTAVFYNSITQQANFDAYYLDNSGNKVLAKIVEENGNRYAVFNIKPITRDEYIFYISGTIVSENKIVLTNNTGSLTDVPEETKEYIKASRFIQSDSSEIRTVSNFIKKSDDHLENIVNITNWVHSYITYDLDYVDVVNDSKKVLAERKGVCDEFAILEASILRAQGYPVKYVVGYANTSQEWGPHAWLEVYVPGQEWIPVDPTYNEVGFVDSSHIVLEKLKDPVESKDSVSSTNKVDVVFGEKTQEFKHNQTKNFEEYGYSTVINMDIISAKDALTESPYIVKLKLQNTTSNPVSILIVSQLAEDFIQIYPKSRKNTYYIKPFENKIVDYYFLLPKLDNSYIYGFAFSSQFNDVEETVSIYTNKGAYQELFFSYDPLVYYKNDLFYFEETFFNYTKLDKSLDFEFDYNGTKYLDTQIIPKGANATYTRSFTKYENVNFNYSISGDYNGFKDVNLLPTVEDVETVDYNQEPRVVVKDSEKDINELFKRIDSQKIGEKPKINYIVVVFISLFVMFILYLLISKSIRRAGLQ